MRSKSRLQHAGNLFMGPWMGPLKNSAQRVHKVEKVHEVQTASSLMKEEAFKDNMTRKPQ